MSRSQTFASTRKYNTTHSLKSQGNTRDLIRAFNQYLETFGTDREAWHELGAIYVQNAQLSKALHCFEELLIGDPRNM